MASRGGSNLYVKNFGKDLDESKLCQLFSVYGSITSCKVPMDESGQPKGFGYVNFERPEMAQEAQENLNGHRLENGNCLYVGPFQKKSERQYELRRLHRENLSQRADNLSLYISNMDSMIDEKILEAIFSKYGRVTKTHILRNGSESKGVGFVCFTNMEDANRAMNELNGKWIISKPIYVKFSEHRNEISNSSTRIMSPAIAQRYPSIPPVVHVPTMLIPPTMIRPYSFTSQPPKATPPYPYNRVKSDD